MNYTEAYKELQEIVAEIEQGETSVDVLSKKVKRASELIQLCKNILSETEGDVNAILQELAKQEDKS
ncbi:MAG: exodeoxyribonuclease VII small subunit [Flavobacteriales bacterium]